jgi:nucleotide-binding universal stress UspA family protein
MTQEERKEGRSVQSHSGPAFSKILVALDGSKNAGWAAKVAMKMAERNLAKLAVVSVVQTPSYLLAPVSGAPVPPIGMNNYYTYATKQAEKWVNEVVSKAKGRGIDASGRVLRASSAVLSITKYAKSQDIDLIVTGTRGLGGFNRLLLGSVSSGVVSHAPCSVLVVR